MIANRDLAPERQARLSDIVRQYGAVRGDQLSNLLAVSAATVRRDLESLEQQRKIRRVHGGAVSLRSSLEEPLFDDKASIAVTEKRSIAAEAAMHVSDGETIYLDGGSTVLELARMLTARNDITVVTNSLHAAMELSATEVRLILVGGELRKRSQTIVGALTRKILDDLHVDVAFMGTIGLTPDEGLTTTDAGEAYTKELVMNHADRVILLADSAKIGKTSFAKAGDLEQIDILITDKQINNAIAARLGKKMKIVTV